MHLIYDLKQNNSIEMWKYYNMDMQSYTCDVIHTHTHTARSWAQLLSSAGLVWVNECANERVCMCVFMCRTDSSSFHLTNTNTYVSLPSLLLFLLFRSFLVVRFCFPFFFFSGSVHLPFPSFGFIIFGIHQTQHTHTHTTHCNRTHDSNVLSLSLKHPCYGIRYAICNVSVFFFNGNTLFNLILFPFNHWICF